MLAPSHGSSFSLPCCDAAPAVVVEIEGFNGVVRLRHLSVEGQILRVYVSLVLLLLLIAHHVDVPICSFLKAEKTKFMKHWCNGGELKHEHLISPIRCSYGYAMQLRLSGARPRSSSVYTKTGPWGQRGEGSP